jgi:hypothetical protein
MKVKSSTGAMADLFEGQKDRLGEYLKAFRMVECQVGAVFAVNGGVLGLHCFSYQLTFSKKSANFEQEVDKLSGYPKIDMIAKELGGGAGFKSLHCHQNH